MASVPDESLQSHEGGLVQGLMELLEIELEQEGVQTYARGDMQLVLKEMELNLSGLTVSSVIKLGQMMGVDYFVWGKYSKTQEDSPMISVRMVEARTGNIRGILASPLTPERLEQTAMEIARDLARLAGSGTAGTLTLAVTPIQNQSGFDELVPLELGLRTLLVEHLLANTDIRVLERETVHPLLQEIELIQSGHIVPEGALPKRDASYLLTGQLIRLRKEDDITLQFELLRASTQKRLQKFEIELPPSKFDRVGPAVTDKILAALETDTRTSPDHEPGKYDETTFLLKSAFGQVWRSVGLMHLIPGCFPDLTDRFFTRWPGEEIGYVRGRERFILDRAVNSLECFLMIRPDELRAKMLLARCLALSGDPRVRNHERARELFEEIYRKDNEGRLKTIALDHLTDLYDRNSHQRAKSLRQFFQETPARFRSPQYQRWFNSLADAAEIYLRKPSPDLPSGLECIQDYFSFLANQDLRSHRAAAETIIRATDLLAQIPDTDPGQLIAVVQLLEEWMATPSPYLRLPATRAMAKIFLKRNQRKAAATFHLTAAGICLGQEDSWFSGLSSLKSGFQLLRDEGDIEHLLKALEFAVDDYGDSQDFDPSTLEPFEPMKSAHRGVAEAIRRFEISHRKATEEMPMPTRSSNSLHGVIDGVAPGELCYIDRSGGVVIRPMAMAEFIGKFSKSLARVRTAGKWGYIDRKGETVIPFRYDEAEDFFNGWAAVRIDREWGYIQTNGEQVLPPRLDRAADSIGGMARVSLGARLHWLTTAGEIKEAMPFDYAFNLCDGRARIGLAGRWGYMDAQGQIVVNPNWVAASDFSEGLASVKQGGKWGAIDRSGKMVVEPFFDSPFEFSEGLAAVRLGTEYTIAENGEIIFQPPFEMAWDFADGMARVEHLKKHGYVDRTGKLAIPPLFENALDFSEGLAAVQHKGRWGYIDTAGKFVVPPQYDRARPFSEGLACVTSKGKVAYIDKQQNVVFESNLKGQHHDFSDGLARVSDAGFIDKQGRLILKVESFFNDFSEGLARVETGLFKNGYIDRTGKFAIEPVFGVAADFSDGLAYVRVAVNTDRGWAYIDKTGTIKILLEERKGGVMAALGSFVEGSNFSAGLAAVRIWQQAPRDPDIGARMNYPCYGFIDKTGTVVIEPVFDEAGPFSNGLARVAKGQDWGYIDRNGGMVIPPQYEKASDFSEGLARVREASGQWNYVDQHGRRLWQPIDPIPALLRRLTQNKPLRFGDSRAIKAERMRILTILARLGPKAQAVLEPLMALWEEWDPEFRKDAAILLGRIGPEAVPALIEILEEELTPDALLETIRLQQAAKALGQIGPPAKAAVAVLVAALKDFNNVNSIHVRRAAAIALGKIGPEARAAIPALLNALNDKDGLVPSAAAVALGRIGGPALQHLIHRLSDPAPPNRILAARGLWASGINARVALPALEKALQDKEESVRQEAAIALEAIQDERLSE